MTVRPDVMIIGAGPMAQAHAAVLKALNVPVSALCRTSESAARFREATGCEAFDGGLESWLASNAAPSRAIVALPVAALADATIQLVKAGCKTVLTEKPGGVDLAEILAVRHAAHNAGTKVYLAYNRRFYESVRAAKRLIEADGGVTSFTFEFTELGDRVSQLPYPAAVLENWEIANSTHVTDTAFFLGGAPKTIIGQISGSLPWHPRCARYSGHGVTKDGALFSYSADWDAPGRWGIEINTRANRYVLRPIEALQRQKRGTFVAEAVEIDDALDRQFKPGLYRQMQAWLGDAGSESLIDIEQHAQAMELFTRHVMCQAAE